MKLLILLVFLSVQVKAAQLMHLENSWNLFSQELGPGFHLPEPRSDRVSLIIEFELPAQGSTTLKKMYADTFTSGDLKVTFEIYYFNKGLQEYLSQQISITKGQETVSRCTSYFGLEQRFLVPGSCAGNVGGTLFGVALYKSP